MPIVRRSEKIAFLGIKSGETTTYSRMTNFTNMSHSKNPKEYTRKYVDEDFDRTDIVGFSPSIGYAFDQNPDSVVHQALVAIADGELKGDSAIVDIVIVDLADEKTPAGTYAAKKRSFTVVPDSDGGGTDAYTYSGTFKAHGELVSGTATTTGAWDDAVFVEES